MLRRACKVNRQRQCTSGQQGPRLNGGDAHPRRLEQVRVHGLLDCADTGLLAEVVRAQQAEVVVWIAVVERQDQVYQRLAAAPRPRQHLMSAPCDNQQKLVCVDIGALPSSTITHPQRKPADEGVQSLNQHNRWRGQFASTATPIAHSCACHAMQDSGRRRGRRRDVIRHITEPGADTAVLGCRTPGNFASGP